MMKLFLVCSLLCFGIVISVMLYTRHEYGHVVHVHDTQNAMFNLQQFVFLSAEQLTIVRQGKKERDHLLTTQLCGVQCKDMQRTIFLRMLALCAIGMHNTISLPRQQFQIPHAVYNDSLYKHALANQTAIKHLSKKNTQSRLLTLEKMIIGS